MADGTGISWTDATWNPVRGCSRVSEGCRNCYAERVAARFSGPGQPYEGLADRARKGSKWTGAVRLIPEHLADPLKWKRPRRIFVNSMSDLFHESLKNEQIAAVFGVMAMAGRHTFQVLTKRARRMREWFEWAQSAEEDPTSTIMKEAICWGDVGDAMPVVFDRPPWPLPNVWIGASVESQEPADERIPDLLATPAAVRFLSCEPLLGPVRLDDIGKGWSSLARTFAASMTPRGDRVGIDWVIAGCESGPGARPCESGWLRAIRDQCADAGTAFFLKQAKGWDHGRTEMVAMGVGFGDGSKHKSGGVIELPYLDGVQHAAFPEVSP
jgi:protein gp37